MVIFALSPHEIFKKLTGMCTKWVIFKIQYDFFPYNTHVEDVAWKLNQHQAKFNCLRVHMHNILGMKVAISKLFLKHFR